MDLGTVPYAIMVHDGRWQVVGLDVDDIALGRLTSERIDWRHKGFPARFEGMTVGELVATGPTLHELATPLLYLDAEALDHNLGTMARYCAAHQVHLAPHAKTTMSPQLIARQLEAGAWGVTAATIGHVRTYRAFGVGTIVLANQLIDPDALAWVAAELGSDRSFRLLCFADSVDGVRLMQDALSAAGSAPDRPVEVIIDLGAPGCRTGCRSLDEAEQVAQSVRASTGLRLAGVGGFEGALAGDRSADALGTIKAYLQNLVALALRLDSAGLFDETDEIIATAGGSAYFDDVAAALTSIGGTSRPVRAILRSGAYVSHDDAHYRELTPLKGRDGFRPALRLRGRVLSQPEPGLALLDFGKRDAPGDLGFPVPLWRSGRSGRVADLDAAAITALADQHAFLAFPAQLPIAVGDIVTCGISHPCTAFDKWRLIPVVSGSTVTDIVTTFF